MTKRSVPRTAVPAQPTPERERRMPTRNAYAAIHITSARALARGKTIMTVPKIKERAPLSAATIRS